MQSYRRLTRPRAALDHEHAPARGSDDPVLLGLDRGHDVAHPAVAGRGHRGDEGPLALQLAGGHGGLGGTLRGSLGSQGGKVQDLVLHPEHLAGPGIDVPTAHQPHGMGGCGLVEGPGKGGAPVQDHLTVLSVLQTDAAHVVAPSPVRDRGGAAHAPARSGGGCRGVSGSGCSSGVVGRAAHVHPPEDQPVLDSLQGGDQRRVVHGVGVPLPARLVGSADTLGLGSCQGAAGLGQLTVQLAVGEVDDLLLTMYLALADSARIVSRVVLCPLTCFPLRLRRVGGDRLTHKASHRFWFWPAGTCRH